MGSERVNAEGYVEIKVSEPAKWRSKHKVIWEKYNYPIPKGYVVIFADQNKANFALDNLLLVSRSQLLTMNPTALSKQVMLPEQKLAYC